MFKPILRNMGMTCIINRLAFIVLCTFLCLDTYAQVTTFYWTDTKGIHKANADGSRHQTLVDIVFRSPGEMDVDLAGNKVYWVDEGFNEIRRSNLDGTEVETVLETGDFPRGIALDIAGGKVYWTEFGVVKRANLDGTEAEEITFLPGFQERIELDVAAGTMYWAAKNVGLIRKSNMDGTGVGVVAAGITRPEGIALDIPSGKAYWTFASGIMRANFDTSEEEVLVTDIDEPIDIGLDLEAGKMYWTERNTQKIWRANLDGTDMEDVTPEGLAKPTSIWIDAESDAFYWMGGSESSIRRSDLDVSNTEVLIENKTRTPLGIVLDSDAGKMYWTDGDASRIQRANLDGSGIEDLLEFSVGYPDQIFLDLSADKIYWTEIDQDADSSAFRRANLDGSDVENLGDSRGSITAIDVEGGKAFGYTGSNELNRTIFRQNLDGTEREELVAGVALTDLAIDIPGEKLYWTDGNNAASITRMNLDGTDVETVLSFSTRLNNLRRIAIDSEERKLYWVNQGATMEEIWKAGLDGVLGPDGGVREYLVTSPILQGVYELALSNEEPTSTGVSVNEFPRSIALSQPYPNPFASLVTFEVESGRTDHVRLDIYDVLGRRVATVFNGVLSTGMHRLVWDATSAGAGVYVARLQGEGYVENRRVIKIE